MSRAPKPIFVGLSMDASRNEKGQPYYWIKENYCEAIWRAGGIPVPLPVPTLKKKHAEQMSCINALVITGGNFDIHPRHFGKKLTHKERNINESRTDFELNLLHMAEKKHLPVLGICGGMQLMNVYAGGTLHAHVDGHEGGMHGLKLTPNGHLIRMFKLKNLPVNTSHHQAIDRLGKNLNISAVHAKDGLVEAIEGPNRNWLGVQWHPEAMLNSHPEQLKVYEFLVKSARPRKKT